MVPTSGQRPETTLGLPWASSLPLEPAPSLVQTLPPLDAEVSQQGQSELSPPSHFYSSHNFTKSEISSPFSLELSFLAERHTSPREPPFTKNSHPVPNGREIPQPGTILKDDHRPNEHWNPQIPRWDASETHPSSAGLVFTPLSVWNPATYNCSLQHPRDAGNEPPQKRNPWLRETQVSHHGEVR